MNLNTFIYFFVMSDLNVRECCNIIRGKCVCMYSTLKSDYLPMTMNEIKIENTRILRNIKYNINNRIKKPVSRYT